MNSSETQKEMYIATMVHDLKNPLQAQITCLEQLSKGLYGKLNGQQAEIIKLTLDSCNYMKNLLQTILETYKNDNGQIILQKKWFNPENLVKTILYEYSSIMTEKKLELDFRAELEEKENILLADENQIRRVIENILNNQIYYAFHQTTIKVRLYKNEENLAFSFENSSPEINKEVQSEIFEKFKTYNVIKQKFSTGLGLYLAKQIITTHGGKIYLIANGNSNKFVFEIPLNKVTKNQVVW